MARRPQVKRGTLSGVPVYQAGGDGPVRAGLFFRVGRQDERAPDAGITHLVEHLALFRFGQQHFEYNGSVDSTWTVFWCSGAPEEVGGFMTDLVRNLHDLPLDRLETEQRVLIDESARRPNSSFDHHAWLRYGLRGAGMGYLDELGLYRLKTDDVRAWASKYFTAGNAAMVWTGGKMPLRELALPPGERMTSTSPPELIAEPTWAVNGPNLVTFSVQLPRTHGALAATRTLSRRLQQVLRYDKGISYDVSMVYQPLNAEHGMATIGASTAQNDAAAVRDVFVEEIERYRREGPSAEDLAADLGRMRREESPLPALSEGARMAAVEVLGGDIETDAEARKLAAEVTQEIAHAAFAAAARRVIMTVPPEVAGPAVGYASYPVLTPGTVEGRPFHDRRERTMSMKNAYPVLTVGDAGVSMVYPDASSMRVLWKDCVLAVIGRDRSVAVVDVTGGHIGFHPTMLAGGADVTDLVLSHVPESRIVRLPFDATALPIPPKQSNAPVYLAGIGLWLIGSVGAAGLGWVSRSVSTDWLPQGETLGTRLAGLVMMAAAVALPILVYRARTGRIRTWTAMRIELVLLLVGIVAWVASGASTKALSFPVIAAGIAAVYARLGELLRGFGRFRRADDQDAEPSGVSSPPAGGAG